MKMTITADVEGRTLEIIGDYFHDEELADWEYCNLVDGKNKVSIGNMLYELGANDKVNTIFLSGCKEKYEEIIADMEVQNAHVRRAG